MKSSYCGALDKECIVCSENLLSNELSLNMNFHAKCANKVFETAWKQLNKENEVGVNICLNISTAK